MLFSWHSISWKGEDIVSNAAQLSDERQPTYRTRVWAFASAGVFGCAGS